MNNVNMISIMALSAILSAMYIWVDKMSDVRISLNDIFMVLLMIGWMLLFSGNILAGLPIVLIAIYMIREQTFVTEKQFIRGMIPHHSMAILMSKKLLENRRQISPELRQLALNIIKTQSDEIAILKHLE